MKLTLLQIFIIIVTITILYGLYGLYTNTQPTNIEKFKSNNSTLKNKVNINSEQIEELKKKLIDAQTQLIEIEKKQKKMDHMVQKGQKIGNKIKNRKQK